MNLSDLKQSKYLKKEDVGDGVLVTISGITQENVAVEGAEPDVRAVLHFVELEKPMVLNSTNGQAIAKITGRDDDIENTWAGAKVVLYNDPNVSYGGKLTGGIRVRAARNQAQAKPVQTKPVQSQNTFSDGVPIPSDDSMPF